MTTLYDVNRRLEDEDYPALYQSANTASLDAQKLHFLCLRGYLIILIVAAAFALVASQSRWAGVVSAALFLSTLFISIYMRTSKSDRVWYNGRAVAESVKTRSWRYMMRAEPYENADSVHVVRSDFNSTLSEILKQNTDLGHLLGGDACAGEQITRSMKEVRSLDLVARKKVYLQHRIDEQRRWYARKSGTNKRGYSKWFAVMIALQCLALFCVLTQIAQPTWDLLPTGILAVAAAGALTWMQAKKFQELTAAYSLTAHEIGFVRGELDRVESEEEFSDFVKDAENAFSREHTQWLARQDK